jgi:hypothetical protein
MKTNNEILRELDKVIHYFIGHSENEPKTEFCNNVDKLINIKADLAKSTNNSNKQPIGGHLF